MDFMVYTRVFIYVHFKRSADRYKDYFNAICKGVVVKIGVIEYIP